MSRNGAGTYGVRRPVSWTASWFQTELARELRVILSELCRSSERTASFISEDHNLRPHSQHLVDWFHLSMRMTNLGQFLKGLAHLDAERAAELQDALQHTRWNLWHGKVKRASHWLRHIEWHMWHFASSYAKFWPLARLVHGFQRYLWRNGGLVPNYARRRRAGQAISTAFVESNITVRCLVVLPESPEFRCCLPERLLESMPPSTLVPSERGSKGLAVL